MKFAPSAAAPSTSPQSSLRLRIARRVRAARGAEGERGQTVVEFVLVALLLVTLTASVFELGWYIHNRSSIDQAAMQAAREAATEGAVTTDATSDGNSIITGAHLSLNAASYRFCIG